MIFKLNAQVFTYFALTSDQPLSKLSSLQQFSILAKNQTVVKIFIVDCQLFIIIISAEKSLFNSSHQVMPPYGSSTDRPRCPTPWGGAVAMAFAERRVGNAPVGTSLCSMQWRIPEDNTREKKLNKYFL
ncbi:hypothetical protein OUZ56_006261 [Daphnia magna]|uniref:Uncharacterized protein n=1 Tax=Daphnia magna TaxID=35525 RepID=A0ABQ9YV42_9CRUS|nr:hypothetical protein OUZ56_006261 [Daphnia magna]